VASLPRQDLGEVHATYFLLLTFKKIHWSCHSVSRLIAWECCLRRAELGDAGGLNRRPLWVAILSMSGPCQCPMGARVGDPGANLIGDN
jgi:hypothetical protein